MMGSDKKNNKRKHEKEAEDEVESEDNEEAGVALTKKQKKKAREERRAAKKAEEGVEPEPEPEPEPEEDIKAEAEKDHSKRLAKMLPTRQEKARRGIQDKVRRYVLDLQAKGTTDKKELKKLKIKYKKSLEKNVPGARHQAEQKKKKGYSRVFANK